MKDALLTIGHSSHPGVDFIHLLQRHGVDAVADVRSHPYSRYNPQFRKKELTGLLQDHGIVYVFLGRELGARSENPDCYENGRVQYDRLAARPEFHSGVERLLSGMERYRVALMCAEKDPVTCHRMILVCRQLRSVVSGIGHILDDGSLESNDEAEQRLTRLHDLSPDMFSTREDCVARAYTLQARRIAYTRPSTTRVRGG